MTKLPREEVGYKKLYKNLDLDRELGVVWPSVGENVVILPCIASTKPAPKLKTLDEFDVSFCKSEQVDEDKLLSILERLASEYEHYLCKQLDSLKPLSLEYPCDICGNSSPAEESAHVICTGCQISVHKECYGVHEPCDRFWFCAKCLYYAHEGKCFACSKAGGILKQTDDQRWIHMVCAVLNPSLSFSNPPCKEPVNASTIRKCRGRCGLCHEVSPFLLKCAYGGCTNKFHGSCAAEHLYCDLNNKIIYCLCHDFSKRLMRVWSKRNMVKHRSSYPRLENDVLIRTPRKLQERIETDFMKIINTEPSKAVAAIDKTDAIARYWSSKVQAHGTCFSDIFFYINYLNGEQRE